jgi:hypothetical protein
MLPLTPEQYFDPLQPGESFEKEGIARHDHAADFLRERLGLLPSQLGWTELVIQGTEEDRTIRTEFHGGGRSWLLHRKDPDGYEELIHHTQLTDKLCHLTRTQKQRGGMWSLIYNGVVEDLENGSQVETRFDS